MIKAAALGNFKKKSNKKRFGAIQESLPNAG